MEVSSKKLIIKIKNKLLCNEYVLTNKHIICSFKFLVVCFDHSNGGLVNLSSNCLEELLSEQNITFNSLNENSHLYNILIELKQWHPLISKVEINTNVYAVKNLSDYHLDWSRHEQYFKSFKYNNCILNQQNYDIFQKQEQNIVDIKVYFKLFKKIENINDYGVNFNYLYKLLTKYIIELNNDKCIYFDEISVTIDHLPFAHELGYVYDDNDPCYVYPYMGLIPLYPINS